MKKSCTQENQELRAALRSILGRMSYRRQGNGGIVEFTPKQLDALRDYVTRAAQGVRE